MQWMCNTCQWCRTDDCMHATFDPEIAVHWARWIVAAARFTHTHIVEVVDASGLALCIEKR